MVIWDAKEGITKEFEKQRLWFDREVYWMGESKEEHSFKFEHYVDTPYGAKKETSNMTLDKGMYDYFYRMPPYNIESMLEQELIRVET